jgi:hypothetical protein
MSVWKEHIGCEEERGSFEDDRGLHNVFVFLGGNVMLAQGKKQVVGDWM